MDIFNEKGILEHHLIYIKKGLKLQGNLIQ